MFRSLIANSNGDDRLVMARHLTHATANLIRIWESSSENETMELLGRVQFDLVLLDSSVAGAGSALIREEVKGKGIPGLFTDSSHPRGFTYDERSHWLRCRKEVVDTAFLVEFIERLCSIGFYRDKMFYLKSH
jgi:hypothetical protein